MALKGDTSHIPLTNIIQTLQLNGQVGVLTVYSGKDSGKVRRKLCIEANGTRLLALNRENPEVLRLALVKQKIVTDSQFQNVISTMGPTAVYPGDFLVQRRILAREQVENELVGQFEELIYDVFSWKEARYEFQGGAAPEDLEIFNPRELGQALVFNVSRILMEAVRREDEWGRILSRIHSRREIFIPSDPRSFHVPRKYSSDIDDKAIQEMKGLIDGQHTLEGIVAESTLSSFQVFRVAAMLLEKGEIRPLTTKEKKELAEDFRRRFKTNEVVEIYRHILSSDPQELDIRQKLVQLLERRKEKDKETQNLLLEQYVALVEHHYARQDFGAVLNQLKQVLEIDHHQLFALDKLFDVHYLQKNHREAVATARKIVEAVKAKKEFERGAEILMKVVDLYPTETFLFHELADFFVYANQGENAVMCLKSVASLYEERRELTKLRKTYERIASINPAHAPTLRRIVEAERRSSQPLRSRAVRLGGRLWAVALVALVLAAAGWFAVLDVLTRKSYAVVREDVEVCAEYRNFPQARAILEDFSRRFPYSTLKPSLAKEISGLLDQERDREAQDRKDEEKKNLEFGSFLARLRGHMASKRYLEALTLIQEAHRSPLSEANKKKLAGIEAEIVKYVQAADSLLARARETFQSGHYEEGHRQFLRLLENFPSAPATSGLKMPLLLKSIPPGARVVVGGETLGVTPLVLYYDPFTRFGATLHKAGFRPLQVGDESGGERRLDFTRDWMLSVRLERIPAWVFDARSPVDCTPLALGGRLYFGTRKGKLYCLDPSNGTEHWNYSVPDSWDVASGIRAYRDRICFGTLEGTLHIVEADTGRLLHRLVPLSPPRPIRHPASEATESGLMAVNCGGATVAAVNAATGVVAWTTRAEPEAVGGPELHAGHFLAAMSDGSVHLLDLATGALQRRIGVGSRFAVPGRAVGETYVAGDLHGRIRRVNLRSGEIHWTYDSPMEGLTTPAVGADLVFFGAQDGLMAALDLKTGDLRWRGKLSDGVVQTPLWHGDNFYLGTRSGQGVCLQGATGSVVWTFTAAGPFGAPPGTAGRLVLFGSADNRLYAFEE